MESMNTVFKFVFEKAGETPIAQTGDWLATLLTVLFAVVAVSAIVFAFIKTDKFKSATCGASHSATKVTIQTKTIVAVLVAAFAIVGAIVSAANTPAIKAFAGANANGMEYKNLITATVHEDTQTVTFEGNYFKNTEEEAIHIDNSSLKLTEEGKAALGDFDLRLQAQYSDGSTFVFDDNADKSNPYLPKDQYELAPNNTRNIVYGSNLTYEMALKLCEVEEAFSLELVPAKCVTVSYDKWDATSGEPPHSQTVSKSDQGDMKQLFTYAPGKGTLAKSGYAFVNWNTKADGTGTPYNEGQVINPADESLTLYPQWENASGYTIKFYNDGKGIAKEKGKPAPTGDLTLVIPIETSYSINDAGEITFTKGGATLFTVETSADKYISYSKWERKGSTTTSGTIEDEDPFQVSFTYDEFTIKYQGAYPDDPHGTMKPNGVVSDEVTEYEEKFQPANPTNAKAPKGVTAIQLEEKPDDAQYLYYFVNWTDSEGNPVAVGADPKELVPTEPETGWQNATYVVHYATPKAIYSENAQTGENLMKFYFDEDPHPEAKQGDRNNAFKFYVNESKFEWDEYGNITNIISPSWFTPAIMSAGKIVAYPTPMVWPTKVEFDEGFKNFKNLKSTDMWFMDADAISVLEMLSEQNGASIGTKTKTRQIKSIVGLENVYTENIESTALMFAAGSPILGIAFPGADIVNDPLQSLDLSSWTNLPKLTGQMTGMFAGCNNLIDLTLPVNKESNFGEFATETTALFYACAGLTSISINNNFCQKSPYMRDLFANCTSLQELKVSTTSLFGDSAEYINEMFLNCVHLCEADLSSFDADADASRLFSECSSIIKIVLPDGFEQSSEIIGLTQDRDWYYYNVSQGSYIEIDEGSIGEHNGGTFTRLAPKAIYNSDDSTLTFYYDYEAHNGEGQSFLINKVSPNENSTIASLFPTWYDVNIYVDDNKVQYVKDIADPSLKGSKVTSYIELKAPASTVIFDQSFARLSELSSIDQPLQYIFGWFMADSIAAHANCLHEFKSKNSDGTWATDKFAYFPSDIVNMWACPFGGFSMEVLYEISNGFFSGLRNPLTVLNGLGNNGEEDAYFSGADTFSAATSLDLSSLKIPQRVGFNALGLVANSPSLTKITMPKTGDSEVAKGSLIDFTPTAQLNWAFMNCSSLIEISEGFMTKQWTISGIYKTFYGCASLETLDLTHFDYKSQNHAINLSNRQFYTFKNCNKLYKISMDGKLWQKGSNNLNMEQCSLPAGVWHNQYYQDKDLSTSEIPVCDLGELSGVFQRSQVTTGKTVTFEVDGTGGSISPQSASVTIYGDTGFVWDGNDIIINGQTIKAVPESTYAVKSWKLNDQRINQNGFADSINTIHYSDADSFVFKVTFVSDTLKPKAVYNENDKTFTFYYDTEPHTGEGLQVFDVYKDTHFNINTNNLTIDAKLPAWYDYTVSKTIDAELSNFSFNTQLKINATKVIFSKSFIDYDDLESISMWFMADHSGKQTFKEFYSEAENGQLIPGFSNINTTSIENVAFAFGGFSMLASALNTQVFKNELDSINLEDPSAVDNLTKLIKVLTGEAYNKQHDTFGSSLQNIDISTFDQAHNVSNYSALFCNCRSLYSIELGENIKDANITNMSAMFQNCESLGLDPSQTQIIKHLDQLDTSNTTNMDLLFFGDFNIKNFNLANFNTEKTVVSNASFGNQSWNTRLMFWDCTRLNSITISSKFNKEKEGFVEGWATPLLKCFLMDNNDPDNPGEINIWTNTDTGKTVDSTKVIPFENYPPKEVEVMTGTFTRKPLNESKTIFKVDDITKGTVNGQESVTYSYIQTDNVRLDQNKPSDMLSDNYRITPEPKSADYKFDHWETGSGFEVQGKVVTAQDQWLFDVTTDRETERELVAVFEDAAKSAKAVYEKPTEANGTGHLTFYYDSDPHTGANVEVFDVKTDTGVYNLPAWYEESDIEPWVEGEDRPVPYFSDKIDTGAGHPETIVVNFDSSFAQFRQLTSLSCWFMPAIDRNNNNALYHPFKFDSDNFQGLNNINTESVYNLWYMFGGHENANDYSGSHTTEINLTDFDTEHKLQNLDGLFANCADLETLTLPTGFGTNSTSMSHTFFNCRALIGEKLSLALSNLVTSNVEDMSYMFASYKYESATVTESTTLTFPTSFNNIGKVKTVEGMFAGYTNTKKLIISNDTLKLARNVCANWNYMFANNHSDSSALESIDWSNLSLLNPVNARSMQGMFMNNTAIKNLDFISDNDPARESHFNTSNVTDMSYMFSGCSSLEKYDFNRKSEMTFQTISTQNMSHMFENTAITSVDFSDGFLSVDALTNSNHMFSGCSLLEDVNLDRSSEMGHVSMVQNAMYMFENCPNIEKVNLENFNVSRALIPEDESNPNSEMVASVYNMFVNTDESGNVSANSKINEFTIGRDWGVPMDRTGLATLSGNNPVLWYYKNDWTVTGFSASSIPTKIINLPDHSILPGYGTFTNEKPHNFTLSPNKKLWGDVATSEAASSLTQYMGSVQLSVVSGSTFEEANNVLMVKLSNFDTSVPVYAINNPSKSDFVGWQVYDGSEDEPITIGLGETKSFDTDIDIQAVFENGVTPVAAYGHNPESPGPQDDYQLLIACMSQQEITSYKEQLVKAGLSFVEIPEDGDFSKTEYEQAPWTKPEVASKIKEVLIQNSISNYEDFTSFNGWFKNLSNLESIDGLYFLNTANGVDFTSMFEGCSTIDEILLGSLYDMKTGRITPAINNNSINATNMFKGCASLKTLMLSGVSKIEVGSGMFANCSNLTMLGLSENLNKNLKNDLSFEDSNWCFSGQSTLSSYGIGDIQDKMKKTSDLGIGYAVYVLGKVQDTSKIITNDGTKGQITDNLRSGQYFNELTVSYNASEGITCSAIRTDTSLILSFVITPKTEFMSNYTSTWTITVNNKAIEPYMFYEWNYNDTEIGSQVPVTLSADNDITAKFDVQKYFVAVYNSTDNELRFYYDQSTHEGEGELTTVPKQWYKENGGIVESPFKGNANKSTNVVFDSSVKEYKSLFDTWSWFNGFTELKTIEGLGNLKLANVTNFGYMFNECRSLESIDFSESDGNLTPASFAYMFDQCGKLKSIDISTLYTNGDYIGDQSPTEKMLYKCSGLNKITFGNKWQRSVMANLGEGFSSQWNNVDQALSVNWFQFPNTEYAGSGTFEVAPYSAGFYAEDGLEITSSQYIYFSDSITAKYLVDQDTKNLKVVLSNKTTGVTHEYPINVKRANLNIKFEKWLKNDSEELITEDVIKNEDKFSAVVGEDKNVAAFYFDKDNRTVTFAYDQAIHTGDKYDIPINYEGDYSPILKYVGDPSLLNKVVFDDSFKNFTDITSLNHWFFQCTHLTDIEGLENLNTMYVTSCRSMFQECQNLTTLDLSSWDTSNVSDMNCMFAQCTVLETITFGDNFNTEKVEDFTAMFEWDSKLTELDLSSFSIGTRTKDIPNISEMLWGLSEVTTINLSVKDCKYDYLTEGYKLGGDNCISEVPNLKKIISNGKLKLNLTKAQTFSKGTWVDPSDNIWDPKILDKFGEYLKCSVISFNTNEIVGGSLNITDPIPFVPGKEYAKYETGVDEQGNHKVTIELYQEGHDEPYAKPQSRVYTLDSESSYTWDKWDISPEPTDNKITEDTIITACVKDSKSAKAVYTKNADTNDYTLTFYYDDQTHTGDQIVSVPKHWGMSAYSSNYEYERARSPFAEGDLESYATETVKVVFDESFANCQGIGSMSAWFSNFKKAKNYVGFGYINTTYFGTDTEAGFKNTFANNTSLENINVSEFNTKGDKQQGISACASFANMFFNCINLKSVVFTNENEQNTFCLNGDVSEMFSRCKSLESVDLSSMGEFGVSKAQRMFEYCYKLETIDLGQMRFDDSSMVQDLIKYCFALTSFTSNNNTRARIPFTAINPTLGNWSFNGTQIGIPKESLRAGTYTRLAKELCTITFEATGDRPNDGRCYIEGWHDADGYIDGIVLPSGTELYVEGEAFRVMFRETMSGYTWKEPAVYCKDILNTAKPMWTFISPYKVTAPTTLTYDISDKLMQNDVSSENNINAENTLDPQGDPIDPVEPQVDPVVPEGDEGAPFAAGVLALPALAALGFRKRLRGKHAKL